MAATIETMNRMYKCLRCPTEDNSFKGTKPQIEEHLWKHHISLDQARSIVHCACTVVVQRKSLFGTQKHSDRT